MKVWVIAGLLMASPAIAQDTQRVFTCTDFTSEQIRQKDGLSEYEPQDLQRFEVRLSNDGMSARIRRLTGPDDMPFGSLTKSGGTLRCTTSKYYFNCSSGSRALQMAWSGNFALTYAGVIDRAPTEEGFKPVEGWGMFQVRSGTCERS